MFYKNFEKRLKIKLIIFFNAQIKKICILYGYNLNKDNYILVYGAFHAKRTGEIVEVCDFGIFFNMLELHGSSTQYFECTLFSLGIMGARSCELCTLSNLSNK